MQANHEPQQQHNLADQEAKQPSSDDNACERKLYKQDQLLRLKHEQIIELTTQNELKSISISSLEQQLVQLQQKHEQLGQLFQTVSAVLSHEEQNSKLLLSQIDLLNNGILQMNQNQKNQCDRQMRVQQEHSEIDTDTLNMHQQISQLQVQVHSSGITIQMLETQLQESSTYYKSELASLHSKLELVGQKLLEKDVLLSQQVEIANALQKQIQELLSVEGSESLMEQEYTQDTHETDLTQTIINDQAQKIKEQQHTIEWLGVSNASQEQQIKSLNGDLLRLQSMSQVKVYENDVMKALPAVLTQKLQYVQQLTQFIPQLVDQIAILNLRYDELNNQNLQHHSQLKEVGAHNEQLLAIKAHLEHTNSELKSERDYLIRNADTLLKENWKLKSKVMDLCGRSQTLSLLHQTSDEGGDLAGFSSLSELLESFVRLKQAQLSRAQKWFEVL